jgi:hypothetical protein
LELAASATPEFVADASERELAVIAAGQAAAGELLAEGRSLHGKVRARSTALDLVTGLGTVRVALDDPPPEVPVGAFGRITVTTRHREGVRVLPVAALRGAVADGAEVVVCADGHAELRTVKVGYRSEQHWELVAGLQDRERVAVDHVLGLVDGTPIVEDK